MSSLLVLAFPLLISCKGPPVLCVLLAAQPSVQHLPTCRSQFGIGSLSCSDGVTCSSVMQPQISRMALLDSIFQRPRARRYINVVWGARSWENGIQNSHNQTSHPWHQQVRGPCMNRIEASGTEQGLSLLWQPLLQDGHVPSLSSPTCSCSAAARMHTQALTHAARRPDLHTAAACIQPWTGTCPGVAYSLVVVSLSSRQVGAVAVHSCAQAGQQLARRQGSLHCCHQPHLESAALRVPTLL